MGLFSSIFGGGSSTTTITTPPPTEQEIQLQARQLELLDFQLDQLRSQAEQGELFAQELLPLFESEAERAAAAQERADELQPIEDELLQIALDDLRRGGAASPQQIELIEEATSAGLEAGLTDIERFEQEGLERLREELAPSRGLRASDSPIRAAGDRLGAEALRQRGQLSQGFRAAGAQARLNFPLAASGLLQQGALGQQRLAGATSQFQQQLRDAALTNRLNVAGQLGGLGAQLTGSPGATLQGALSPLLQSRLANTTTTSSGGGGFDLAGIGGLTGGVGALLTGLSPVGFFGK